MASHLFDQRTPYEFDARPRVAPMRALFTLLDPTLPVEGAGGRTNRFLPDELGRGPWDADALHGGAIAALIAGEVEQVPAPGPMTVSRLTIELERPVPLRPLTVSTELRRDGRRIQLVDATVVDEHAERTVCRARALRQRVADVPLPDDPALAPVLLPPPAPTNHTQIGTEGADWAAIDPLVRYHSHAVEHRLVTGAPESPGPAIDWIRLRVDVVDGFETTPLQRVAAAADFANGLSHVLDFRRYLFVNPDLTIALVRPPVGEWICLDSRTDHSSVGTGLSSTVLYDDEGYLGRSLQSLHVDRR
jgi:acyl-coenzyme A thioesterase PaaI-like protein